MIKCGYSFFPKSSFQITSSWLSWRNTNEENFCKPIAFLHSEQHPQLEFQLGTFPLNRETHGIADAARPQPRDHLLWLKICPKQYWGKWEHWGDVFQRFKDFLGRWGWRSRLLFEIHQWEGSRLPGPRVYALTGENDPETFAKPWCVRELQRPDRQRYLFKRARRRMPIVKTNF